MIDWKSGIFWYKAVERIDTITGEVVEYASALKAAQLNSKCKGCIAATCKGKRKSFAGFYWQYLTESGV